MGRRARLRGLMAALVVGLFPASGLPEEAAPEPPPAETAAAESLLPDFLREQPKPPDVFEGFDAVVYGMTSETPVEVRLSGDAEWERRETASQLRVGGQVRTLTSSSSLLNLRGRSDQVRLPQESHIEVRALGNDGDQVSLYLFRGSVWSQVQARNKPDAFRVETPELTAGVRGTNFRVDRADAGGTKVSVFEGEVFVRATKTGVYATIGAGRHIVVNAAGQIMDVLANPPDEGAIWEDWQRWAEETALGTGSAVGYGPVSALSQQIAADNARWEADMAEYARNVAEVRYQEKLDEYAGAFLNFARDTGTVPTEEEGWSVLKSDPGTAGWAGPYVEGPVPPLDPWRRPLRYRVLTSRSGNLYGRVYSLWEDGRDQGGDDSALDRIAIIRYFEIPGLKPAE